MDAQADPRGLPVEIRSRIRRCGSGLFGCRRNIFRLIGGIESLDLLQSFRK